MTSRDEGAAHAAADRAEQDARDAPAKLAVAAWNLRREAEEREAARLRGQNHGHEFDYRTRRCWHCGLSELGYRDSAFGISGDENALLCTRLTGRDRPMTRVHARHLAAAEGGPL